MREVTRQSRGRGREGPDRDPDSDDLHSVLTISEPPQRQPHRGVKDRKSRPKEQADLGIGQAEIGFDRLNQQAQHVAIDERKE